MKYISLFSGVEAATLAWEQLGWEPLAFAEVDPFPSAVLAHRWPDVPNIGDVTLADWSPYVGKADVLIGGSPCFPAGTIVEIKECYLPIEQVKVGDYVRTHRNCYKRVLRVGQKRAKTITLKSNRGRTLTCTANHPILSDTWEWVRADEMLGKRWLYLDWGEWEEVASIDFSSDAIVTVYNLEVEDDHSYTANGIAVHNCQSFSIAGKRDSLKGESRLMFEYIRAVDEIRPRFLVWENTPGVLSTRDNAFGQLLHSLVEIGYRDLAYRVLDAQFFKLAQRRRRVFLVGHLAESGFRSAEILGLFDSSAGDTAKESEKREELAADARAGSADADRAGAIIGEPLVMAHGHSHAEIAEGGVAPTVLARAYKDPPMIFARTKQDT